MKIGKHCTDDDLFRFMEDRLETSKRESVQRHLIVCPSCCRRVRSYRNLLHAALLLPLSQPPGDLVQRSIAAWRTSAAVVHPEVPTRARKIWRKLTQERSGLDTRGEVGFRRRLSWQMAAGFLAALALGSAAGDWVSRQSISLAHEDVYKVAMTPQEIQQAEVEGTERLKGLVRGLITYSNDWDECLPPMKDLDGFQARLMPYIKDRSYFNDPLNGQPFLPNAGVSGWAMARFTAPGQSVLLFDSQESGGTRRVAVATGNVTRVNKTEWAQLNRKLPIRMPAMPPTQRPKLVVFSVPGGKSGEITAENIPLRDVLARLYLEERRLQKDLNGDDDSLTRDLRIRYRLMGSDVYKASLAVGHSDTGTFGWAAYQKRFGVLSDRELGLDIDRRLKNWKITYHFSSPKQRSNTDAPVWTEWVYLDLEERYGLDIQHENGRLVVKPKRGYGKEAKWVR